MGTRNLTLVKHEGKTKLAKYCQWDGYPSGQGLIALDFLRDKFNRERFLTGLAKVYEPNEKEIRKMWIEAGDKEESDGWVTMDVSNNMKSLYPTMQRDMGAGILEYIQNSNQERIPVMNERGFAKDGLFCEWAYLVDLDENVLKVFKGFNRKKSIFKKKSSQEFGDLFDPKEEYTPIVMENFYSLDHLPDNKAFLAELEGAKEEEAA